MAYEFYADEHQMHLTLDEVAMLGLGVKFHCTQCKSEFDLDLQELIIKHGGETRLNYIRRNAKCQYCSDP